MLVFAIPSGITIPLYKIPVMEFLGSRRAQLLLDHHELATRTSFVLA